MPPRHRKSEATTRHSMAVSKKKELEEARVNPDLRVHSDTDSSEEDYPAFGKKRNRLHTPVPRSSWQMEALEAMRLGDVFRLRTVYERKGANVNLATKEKAYGGFRYITWGPKSYGGEPDGETMLHLAVRPDNGRYPTGQHKRAKFPTSKAPISAIFHSFRLTFGRAIISSNGLDAWMLFPERARAEHSR